MRVSLIGRMDRSMFRGRACRTRTVKQIYESSMDECRTVGKPKKTWLNGVTVALKKERYSEYEEQNM